MLKCIQGPGLTVWYIGAIPSQDPAASYQYSCVGILYVHLFLFPGGGFPTRWHRYVNHKQGFIQRESFWGGGEAPGNGCGFIYFSIQLSQILEGEASPPPPPDETLTRDPLHHYSTAKLLVFCSGTYQCVIVTNGVHV